MVIYISSDILPVQSNVLIRAKFYRKTPRSEPPTRPRLQRWNSTCRYLTYPYAIKNQRKARNAPSRGHFVPKPLVGGFECLELVPYGIRELA